MSYSLTCSILEKTLVAAETWRLTLDAPEIAADAAPGRFVNVLTDPSCEPLLRRPYSISDVRDDSVDIVFSVVGKGTARLAALSEGDCLDVLGPLGNSFGLEDAYGTAVLLGGGVGIAPFPLAIRSLEVLDRPFVTIYGARTEALLVRKGMHLRNTHFVTDDGSSGDRGTVLTVLESLMDSLDSPKLFACGPTPMLAAVQRFALEREIPCELSLESEMACGIGICQGCPVTRVGKEKSYALTCTEGPCFDAREITLCLHDKEVS